MGDYILPLIDLLLKMMRFIIALILSICSAVAVNTVNPTAVFQDFMTASMTNRLITLTPLQPFADYTNTILSAQPVKKIGTNASITFSNVVSGYMYRLQLDGPVVSTVRTCGFPATLTGNVNFRDWLGVKVDAQNFAFYYQTGQLASVIAGTNIIVRTSGNDFFIDVDPGMTQAITNHANGNGTATTNLILAVGTATTNGYTTSLQVQGTSTTNTFATQTALANQGTAITNSQSAQGTAVTNYANSLTNKVAGTNRLVNTTAPLTGGGALVSDLMIAIPVATSGVDGYLSHSDFATFLAKQAAGNYITALTGDGAATGPGSSAFTLATVATPGTSTKVTYNAKGLVTSGTTLSPSDIPSLDASKITTGQLPIPSGGTGAATANAALGNLSITLSNLANQIATIVNLGLGTNVQASNIVNGGVLSISVLDNTTNLTKGGTGITVTRNGQTNTFSLTGNALDFNAHPTNDFASTNQGIVRQLSDGSNKTSNAVVTVTGAGSVTTSISGNTLTINGSGGGSSPVPLQMTQTNFQFSTSGDDWIGIVTNDNAKPYSGWLEILCTNAVGNQDHIWLYYAFRNSAGNFGGTMFVPPSSLIAGVIDSVRISSSSSSHKASLDVHMVAGFSDVYGFTINQYGTNFGAFHPVNNEASLGSDQMLTPSETTMVTTATLGGDGSGLSGVNAVSLNNAGDTFGVFSGAWLSSLPISYGPSDNGQTISTDGTGGTIIGGNQVANQLFVGALSGNANTSTKATNAINATNLISSGVSITNTAPAFAADWSNTNRDSWLDMTVQLNPSVANAAILDVVFNTRGYTNTIEVPALTLSQPFRAAPSFHLLPNEQITLRTNRSGTGTSIIVEQFHVY